MRVGAIWGISRGLIIKPQVPLGEWGASPLHSFASGCRALNLFVTDIWKLAIIYLLRRHCAWLTYNNRQAAKLNGLTWDQQHKQVQSTNKSYVCATIHLPQNFGKLGPGNLHGMDQTLVTGDG